MSGYHLAQLNIAILKESLDSPALAEFVENLDRINAIAETSDGYVWRLKTDGNNATSLRPLGENILVNMSVWQDIESLNEYVYNSAHTDIMRKRRQWFERMSEMYVVLWWVPQGHYPQIDEALAKLEWLRLHGPSPEAFTFLAPFPHP
jgi:hypothetical protein